MTEVPFSDLRAQYRSIKAEIDAAIAGVLDSQRFIGGATLREFEAEFADAVGAKYAVGVSNGTAALSLALEAAGIKPGDEVLVPSMTFAATAEAICHVGAIPVFVDSDDKTLTMSVQSLRDHIGARTRAVIPVHLYGNPCDMNPIIQVAKQFGLIVIEDSAQAHLATYRDRPVGAFSDAATYSFFPGKNLGAFGDAGAVTTSSDEIADRVRLLRDHGRSSKYSHTVVGYNHRLDALQAAVLRVKLRHLKSWTASRRAIARQYDEAFRAAGIRTMVTLPAAQAVYHLYPILVTNRDRTLGQLRDAGVSAGIHYPIPLHRQSAFSQFTEPHRSLPVSENIGASEISLPIFPEMTQEQVERVTSLVTEFARSDREG